MMQQDVGRLVKGGTHHCVAAAADVPVMPGAIAPSGRTEACSDVSLEKRSGASIPVRYVRATTVPTPGTVIGRWQRGYRRAN